MEDTSGDFRRAGSATNLASSLFLFHSEQKREEAPDLAVTNALCARVKPAPKCLAQPRFELTRQSRPLFRCCEAVHGFSAAAETLEIQNLIDPEVSDVLT
jgi:hypothetical protein